MSEQHIKPSYYNEFDVYPAQWLRNLIAAGHIKHGHVDTRSIVDVKSDDLRDYDRCHFFAGISGWGRALRLAGVPDDFPVWTGSCPCQPFSVAGKRKAHDDERDLWPEFRRLIAERRPPIIFGEQVASPLGREWLSGVRADLETLGYAVGAVDLCAAGVGAPHIRPRLYWGATALRVGNANDTRSQGRLFGGDGPYQWTSGPPSVGDPWNLSPIGADCGGGRWRRIGPGTFTVADGVPGRVGRIRAYGNSIVSPLAAVFIREFLEGVECE